MDRSFNYRIGFVVRAQIIDMQSADLERKDVYGVIVGYHTYNDGNVVNVKCLDTGKIIAVDAQNVFPIPLKESHLLCMGYVKSRGFSNEYVMRIKANGKIVSRIYYNVKKHKLTILTADGSLIDVCNIIYMHQFQMALDLVGLYIDEYMYNNFY